MNLKLKRNTLLFFLGVVLIIPLSFFNADKTFLLTFKEDLVQLVMSMDLGFSHRTNLVDSGAGEVSTQDNYDTNKILSKLKSIPKIIKYKLNRPSFDRLDIDIPFLSYKTIMEDRERAMRSKLNTQPTLVKAKIQYKGKTYKAKIRLKGDAEDHWLSKYRMSLKVKLKDNSILGFTEFSIQKPSARQFPYDLSYQSILNHLGNLSSVHKFADTYVNGVSWGIMNLEEHMTKEFLEKQRRKESLIVRYGNEDKWVYNLASKTPYRNYLLSDPTLNISIFSGKKYLKDPRNRQIYSYIVKKQANFDPDLYDTTSMLKSYALSTIWSNWHTLQDANQRYYFNPYTLKLESISTDQGSYDELKGLGSIKFAQLPQQFSKILSNQAAKTELLTIFQEIPNFQNYFDDSIQYFPVDLNKKTQLLNKNYVEFFSNQSLYSDPIGNPKEGHSFRPCSPGIGVAGLTACPETAVPSYDQALPTYDQALPTYDQASEFKKHIHVRHFSNGDLEIRNLLPDTVKINQILYQGTPVQDISISIPGYNTISKSKVIKTEFIGIHDNKISLSSSYQGFEAVIENNYTIISELLSNPLSEKSFNCSLTCSFNGKEYVFKGKELINNPIIINGDVLILPGTHLSFTPNSYMIVKGSLTVLGTPKKPVIFDSTKDYWKGIYVLNAAKESKIFNASFKNLRALEDGLLKLTGAITFYKSDVHMQKVVINDIISEDAINTIESSYNFEDIIISNAISDAFDSDYSAGYITNSSFIEIGGDALDFSGSSAIIDNVRVSKVGDKGVSAGEKSSVKISNSYFEYVSIGVTSKDSSDVLLNKTSITDFDSYGVMSFTKKDFYFDPATIKILDCDIEGPYAYLSQKGTQMFVDSKKIIEKEFDVDKLYKKSTEVL